MRVCMIGRDYQATKIDAGDSARRFMVWFTDGANPVLAEAIRTWLWQPPDAGWLGALAGTGRDVAALRSGIAALRPRIPQQREPDGREAR